MGDQLHQMTVEFVAAEDRLLLRVNTTGRLEYQMWLTRRLVQGIWRLMVGAFAEAPEIKAQPAPRVKRAIMSMQHQEAVETADFKTERETATAPPPGMDGPQLVTAVQCGRVSNSVRRLSFRTSAGKDINVNLTEEMMHALCHLIRQGAEKAGWNLELSIGDAASAPIPPDATALH